MLGEESVGGKSGDVAAPPAASAFDIDGHNGCGVPDFFWGLLNEGSRVHWLERTSFLLGLLVMEL